MSYIDTPEWILVVEDQEDPWTLLQGHLSRLFPGTHLVRASNVITALSHLQAGVMERQSLPRLVLSDLYLPRREDGFHLLTALKSRSSGLTHLPVVMISSSTDPVDEQAVKEGGAAFLTRPANGNEWPVFLHRLKQRWNPAP